MTGSSLTDFMFYIHVSCVNKFYKTYSLLHLPTRTQTLDCLYNYNQMGKLKSFYLVCLTCRQPLLLAHPIWPNVTWRARQTT